MERRGERVHPRKGRRQKTTGTKAAKVRTSVVSIDALKHQLAQRTSELDEALQQQTVTSEVLSVIRKSPADAQPVFEAIVQSAARLCGAIFSVVYLNENDRLRAAATKNFSTLATNQISERQELRQISRSYAGGRTVLDRAIVHVPDVLADPEYSRDFALAGGWRAVLAVPLLHEGKSVGAITVGKAEPKAFSEQQIQLLRTFADQAVIAIENARLFKETQEALERQTATSDILKVIASSPDNVQPVFQAMADRSKRLVNALSTTAFRLVDGMLYLQAFTPTTPQADARLQATFPAPLSAFSWGEAIAKGETYRVIDTEQEPERLRGLARERGWRSALLVPLLRDGKPIGMIGPTRAEPGPFTEHHVQLMQTFADQAVIAIQNVELFDKVQQRTRELSKSLDDLREAQDRLIQTEKLASLGQLTAGIAHEIKNPLNFVNNFSGMSVELIAELQGVVSGLAIDPEAHADIEVLTDMLSANLGKVVQHGKRADAIVKSMLLHSGQGSGEHRLSDINALVDESLNRAYYGERAETRGFTIKLERSFDPDVGAIDLFPREVSRAVVNLISNSFYATRKRKETEGGDYEPVLVAATRNLGDHVEIRIRDNGSGIPSDVKAKMFDPFFTTKPSGEGTGLGLSITHDIIVKQHGGSIEVDTRPGEFAEIRLILPRTGAFFSERE